jgi:hypothetical protein
MISYDAAFALASISALRKIAAATPPMPQLSGLQLAI